jgi:RNA polymerase sigma factor (sigma-70 family)
MESEDSLALLERMRQGDRAALDLLLHRYVPLLRRWARGRLPGWARDMADTEDLVQDTVIRTIPKLDAFEYRHEGALQAYLRQAVLNRIRDECRRAGRRPGLADVHEQIPAGGPSPLEQVIGTEGLRRYDLALQRLKPEQRELIVARLEMGHSYAEVAAICCKPSADAARVAVSRALLRLAEILRDGR